jgi:signal transduction histidine kinase
MDSQESPEKLAGVVRSLEQTVKERTRRLEAANKELDAFTHSVSHDLSTPLAAIKGYAEILADEYGGALGEEARDLLACIDQSVENMRVLIDSLLSLSRLARAEMTPRPLDLRPAVLEIIAQLRAVHPERKVEFHVADDLSAEGDPALLRIVLDNLLVNAWKFTSKRPSALIEVGKVPGSPIMLFVRDNGAGFDASRAERLFSPFQRMHSARDFPGIGVGLAAAQRIIARHGGHIWADSVPGRGATICLTLPASGASAPLRIAA